MEFFVRAAVADVVSRDAVLARVVRRIAVSLRFELRDESAAWWTRRVSLILK